MKDVLFRFGLHSINNLEKIYENVWSVDDKYILKGSLDNTQLEKGLLLSKLLQKAKVPAAEYLESSDGKPYIYADNIYYCLMRKIDGHHLDPLVGDGYMNGLLLGKTVATLHAALYRISNKFDCYEFIYRNELDDWILDELKSKNIHVPDEVVDYCYEFESLYNELPRQLIHRDMHLGNLLFDDKVLSGYLDFDIGQKNARIFDLCYLGASMLVDHYRDESLFRTWSEVFCGVIHGYEISQKLTKSEIRAIPYMFVFIELTFAAFYSKKGNRDSSISCMEMTAWLYRNKDSIAHSFI